MSEWLKCVECEEEFRFPELLCLYWLGGPAEEPSYRSGQWVRVLRTPVWCAACNRLSYAERVPSLREFEVAAAVRRMPDQTRIGELSDELLNLTDAELLQLANGLRDRTTTGTCLLCGGRSYLPLQIHGGHVRNLRHDDCDGQFKHWLSISSYIGKREIQWYEFSGNLFLKQGDFF